jgi:nicotinate-nucleotide pyrophosphorylase (carboxylating)
MRKLARREVVDIVRRAIREDIGDGDITTQALVNPQRIARGVFLAKEDLVICGLAVVEEVFRQLDRNIRFVSDYRDGDRVGAKTVIARVRACARALLSGERTALNFLCRLCGIATLTAQFVDAVRSTQSQILDTRKTTPTMRSLEKYAVSVGGGKNHRAGLHDAVLIKDNHKVLLGRSEDEVFRKIERLRRDRVLKTPVEVEVSSVREAALAVRAGCKIIMLDNMSVSEMKSAVAAARREAGKLGLPNPLLEASGRVALKNVRQIAKTGVDRISIGSLTHSARAVDISFELSG